uniref:Coiled-coil and C2 domain containing 1B n=1 Tax=Myripristis murdjan TaxID=586833 RepID=A0A668AGJ5_9TELE
SMFAKKKRAPVPKGQGAAAAKQMGLFVDFNPEEMMMGMEENLDDPDLEAELAAITGNKAAAGGKAKQKARTPLPMEDIARMADDCMRDVDEDEDDDNLEDDEDLLVGVSCTVHSYLKVCACIPVYFSNVVPAAPGSLQHTLEERIAMYKTAIQNAKSAGESSKVRRYDRGLKVGEITAETQELHPELCTKGSHLTGLCFHCCGCCVVLSGESTVGEATKAMLLERQKEYKMAALKAKKQGDVEQAKLYIRTSKRFDAVIEALEKGQPVDLSGIPPSPGQDTQDSLLRNKCRENNVMLSSPSAPAVPSAPAPPKDVLEALEQRRAKYAEASAQAKASGDDRKARMHDRIAKQYQSAIRAHKAGKAVNFEELPVPPGFPPIPGQEAAGAEQGFAAVLEAANKLASTDATEGGDDEENEEKEEEQLDFLEGRRKQYMKAALQAKQRNDMDQAKQFLRTAKGFEPMIEAARSGKTVDISKVPSPPGDEDEDFILVHHSDVQISEKAEEVYTQLAKILKEQYDKCMTYSKQFTHLGNVTETTKFEKMAERCKKSLEILKLSQARGLDPPKHHFEERTYHTVRIFPELSSTEMVVVVVRGMNLPAPSGNVDFSWFPFCYQQEQPQKHKTAVIKNTNSPEYNQSFTLSINRNHRGFKRVLLSKGLKLELLHKGGFLRSDKPIGTAHVKLEKLETQSEIREIVEVMDGRKPTGGRVEVRVRLREPLSGQDMQTSTERWGLMLS